MQVRVELSTALRPLVNGYDPQRGITVDLKPGSSVAGLMAALHLDASGVKVIMVNRKAAKPQHLLEHGDLVGLFPSLGGG